MMGPKLVAYACVAAGSALGGLARYWMSLAVTRHLGDAFPWGTLFINIVGSFVIAFFGTLTMADGPHPASAEARLFVLLRADEDVDASSERRGAQRRRDRDLEARAAPLGDGRTSDGDGHQGGGAEHWEAHECSNNDEREAGS